MKGFKEFLLRGNLVEIAVAFIMATAFAKVVESFTKIIMDLLGKAGGQPDFSQVAVGGVNIGVFLTSLVAFIILAAVVYFGIVMPYTRARTHFVKAEADVAATSEDLLTEIRDLLQARNTGL